MADLTDLRARFHFPMLIDEVVRDLDDLCTAVAMRAADAVNIKLTRVGGITRAARLSFSRSHSFVCLNRDAPVMISA